ncbi:MAG: tyrosine-type recombinase/integrase [Thermodesulfobacteriota bacterium]|nr:tyrosine-type recombinase/integrase [Thermodesulfobacteriota bacterium]
MMNSDITLHEAVTSSDSLTISPAKDFDYYQTRFRFGSHSDGSIEALQKILRKLSKMELPGKEHVEGYLRHMARSNRRPRTMYSRWGTILIFLGLLKSNGKNSLEEVTRRDVEAFIEHEQDRGIKITTIRMRLTGVQSFLRHMVEEGIVSRDVFGKRIRLQLPERLPRAMDPDDLQNLLSVIDNTRDRAMILVLLRTGMRIGELLNTKVIDVHMKERRIEIYEAAKNRLGRVVYLSEDAIIALEAWFEKRNPWEDYLFYSQGNTYTLSYSTARCRFKKYIVKAGLDHKGYTPHTLRHTFATELLNVGMRLECLQVLLGHRNIEETRRYARLTDKTREEEYFKAMAIIERGDSHGNDRCDPELEAIFEKAKLCTKYR